MKLESGACLRILRDFVRKSLDSNGRMILAVDVEKSDVMIKSKAKGLDFSIPTVKFSKEEQRLWWICVGLAPRHE